MKSTRTMAAGIDCRIYEPDVVGAETQTIICLHGIGGDDASFAPQQALADQYRVVAWNMPGYKESVELDPLTFGTIAEKLHELIVELDTDTVHLMGQSIGGMIAQEAYVQYPEKINSLILVATTSAFGGADDSFKTMFLEARLKPLSQGMTMQQVASLSMPQIVGKNAPQQVIESAVNSMASLSEDVYRDVLRCLVTFNRRVEWSEIKCPVCLVAGGEDTNAPAATMRKMADKLPHAHFHEISEAGHLVNLEKEHEFNEIALTFLSQLN